MSKEKQIEEMAKHCCNACDFGNQIDLESNIIPCAIDKEHRTCPLALETAEMIYNAGYRKQSEIEKLENKLFKEVFEGVLFSLVYLGADGKWHTKRNNAEKTTAIIERYLKLVAIEKGGEE